MTLNLVIHDADLLQPQRAYVSCDFIENAFKFAALPLTKDLKLICKLIPKTDISKKDCILDCSVVQFTTLHNLEPIVSNNPTSASVIIPDIRIIDSLIDAKSLEVIVIFKSSTDVSRFKKNEDLSSIVNEILTFYTVVNSSLVIPKLQIYNEIIYIHVLNAGSKKCACRITPSTVIKIVRVMSYDKFKRMSVRAESYKVVGLSSQLEFLNSMYDALLKFKTYDQASEEVKLNHKILIIGPSGCGKTALVNYFAKLRKSGLVTVESSFIANALPEKSENILKSFFDEAIEKSRENDDICVLLLDQIDYLCGFQRSAVHSNKISYQLFHLLEEISDYPNVMVIATTNQVSALNPAIRRADRLEIELYIGPPTEKERQEILQLYCSKYGIKTSLTKKIAVRTPGYLGSDLALLVRDIRIIRSKNVQLYENDAALLQLFEELISKRKPASLRSGLGIVHSGNMQMSHLGGLTSVKACLKSFVEWPLKYPDNFKRLGITVPKGILLYGPPGCAKTSLTCAIANATHTNFLAISAAELYSCYVGEAERNVIELFHKARVNSPCIIFIDEIDALVGDRSNSSKSVQEKILSTFLTEMDGVGNKVDSLSIREMKESSSLDKADKTNSSIVIVIAATNRPDKLDSALLRPGRFDKLLYVGAPELDERLDILKTIIKTWKMPLGNCVNLMEIAERTNRFTGADLTNLMRESGLMALFRNGMEADSVTQEHIFESLKYVKPSLTEQYQFKLD